MADHIVIDPNSMVRAARDLHVSIEKAADVERSLDGLDVPSVPAAIAGHVNARVEVIARASQVARLDVVIIANDLRGRADRALAAEGEVEKSTYPDTSKLSLRLRLEGGVVSAAEYTGASFGGDAYDRIVYGEGSWGHVGTQFAKFGLLGLGMATGATELAGAGEAFEAFVGPTGVNVLQGAAATLTGVSLGHNVNEYQEGKITLGQLVGRGAFTAFAELTPAALAKLSPEPAVMTIEEEAPLLLSRTTGFVDGEGGVLIHEPIAVIHPIRITVSHPKPPEALAAVVDASTTLIEEGWTRKQAEAATAAVIESGVVSPLPTSGGLAQWAVMGVANNISLKVAVKGAAGTVLPEGGIKAAVATGAIAAVSATPMGIPATAAIGLARQLTHELGS